MTPEHVIAGEAKHCVIQGNALDVLRGLPSNHYDGLLTDPPYFLANASGKGFMGKEWDSLSPANVIAGLYFMSMSLASNTDAGSVVVASANTTPTVFTNGAPLSLKKDNLTVLASRTSAINAALLTSAADTIRSRSTASTSAPELVITRDEAVELSRVWSPSLTIYLQKLPISARLVAPTSFLDSGVKSIARHVAAMLRDNPAWKESVIGFTSTEEPNESDAIEALSGTGSDSLSIGEMVGCADDAESHASAIKSNATTSSLGKYQRTIQKLISSPSVRAATKRFTATPNAIAIISEWWHECWANEAIRVLKPGAPVLAFSGTRTSHSLTSALEASGFEIRDTLMWLYGSGFPKSLDVSKAIDGAEGAVREVVGKSATATDLARDWAGYGTALKPAHEPIILARKPLEGTIAQNVSRWGTGGLAIDASRIEYASASDKEKMAAGVEKIRAKGGVIEGSWKNSSDLSGANPASDAGRWPANVLMDEEAGAYLDSIVGDRPSTLTGKADPNTSHEHPADPDNTRGSMFGNNKAGGRVYADGGGPSRFFYSAKVSKSEREGGSKQNPFKSAGEVTGGREEGSAAMDSPRTGAGRSSGSRNHHPTLKPIALTSYLAKLILPPKRVDTQRCLLVPFSGSGSEIIGALQAGWDDVTGIEQSEEYCAIARARIAYWENSK